MCVDRGPMDVGSVSVIYVSVMIDADVESGVCVEQCDEE